MAYRKNKNVDNRAYKFRLLPNAEQTVLINKTFGCVRFIKNDDITLKTKEWICPGCNTYHHRDHNAAINIKREGYKAVLAM